MCVIHEHVENDIDTSGIIPGPLQVRRTEARSHEADPLRREEASLVPGSLNGLPGLTSQENPS